MIKARHIPLYVGTRTELDRCFIEIIDCLPAGTNLNEFIKQAVVKSHGQKLNSTEVGLETRQLKLEIMSELMNELQKLKMEIKNTPLDNQEPPKIEALNEEAKRLVDSLTDAF